MAKVTRDEIREDRIHMEAIVDAYNEEERAMGWYYYLEDKLSFPFKGKCIVERRISPLKLGEEIEVIGMAPEDECMHEMFVEVRWSDRELAVPLAEIEAMEADEETHEVIEDWHYWVNMGYEF